MGSQNRQYSIRDMNSGDLIEILKIEQVAQASPWARLSFEESLNREDFCRVVEQSGEVVAYHVSSHILDELHLLNVVCAPRAQGNGFGHVLMQDVFECARIKKVEKVFLEVRASNAIAQSLYEKWGFEKIAVRKHYYRPTLPNGLREDAEVYVANITI